jgi:tetratricopeptide (TPR) repeat protein
LWVLVVLALLVGCKAIGTERPPVDDVTPVKEARMQEAVRQFEERRDAAEFKAAQAARNRGDRAMCRESLDALLARNPGHRGGRLLLADLLLEEGQPQQALEQLQTALAAHPDDPEVHQAMGALMDKLGRPENAWSHYQQAAALARDGAVTPASHETARGPHDGEELNPSKERPPVSPGEVTVTDADGPALLASDSSAARLIRQGEAALSAGSVDLAMGSFRDAAARNPNDPRIPTASAVAALAKNRPDVAIQLADDALGRFDDYAPLLRVLGASYYRRGDYASSQLVLQQALSLDKSDALAYFLLGCTLAKLGQSDAAEANWRHARQLGPSVARETSVEPSVR